MVFTTYDLVFLISKTVKGWSVSNQTTRNSFVALHVIVSYICCPCKQPTDVHLLSWHSYQHCNPWLLEHPNNRAEDPIQVAVKLRLSMLQFHILPICVFTIDTVHHVHTVIRNVRVIHGSVLFIYFNLGDVTGVRFQCLCAT
jgi:hypothetical protein